MNLGGLKNFCWVEAQADEIVVIVAERGFLRRSRTIWSILKTSLRDCRQVLWEFEWIDGFLMLWSTCWQLFISSEVACEMPQVFRIVESFN